MNSFLRILAGAGLVLSLGGCAWLVEPMDLTEAQLVRWRQCEATGKSSNTCVDLIRQQDGLRPADHSDSGVGLAIAQSALGVAAANKSQQAQAQAQRSQQLQVQLQQQRALDAQQRQQTQQAHAARQRQQTAQQTQPKTSGNAIASGANAGTVTEQCAKVQQNAKTNANTTWLTISNGCTQPIHVYWCRTVSRNVCDASGYFWGFELLGGASKTAYYENKTAMGISYFACKLSEGGRTIRRTERQGCVFN